MGNYLDIDKASTMFATSKVLDALSENVNLYIERSTRMIQDINGWQYTWNHILRTDEADIANHQDYITFQNGDIILGESSNNLKVKISNDAIQFKGDSDVDILLTRMQLHGLLVSNSILIEVKYIHLLK